MNAVIYARYSSDSQREESIEGQLRECREYAERNDMTVVGTYIDRALSAKTADRPEFQRMIKDSAKELFEIVLVWKLDRFSRDRYDSAHYKHILKKNGVKVISAKEHISEGPEGIILEAMLEGYAEFYSAELSEKIHRGQKENALKGKNNGGGVPLGYLLDKKAQKLVIDPVTAPLVVEIFEKYADGIASISFLYIKGCSIMLRSILAPIAVLVLSNTHNKEPRFCLSRSVSQSSRFLLVAESRIMKSSMEYSTI